MSDEEIHEDGSTDNGVVIRFRRMADDEEVAYDIVYGNWKDFFDVETSKIDEGVQTAEVKENEVMDSSREHYYGGADYFDKIIIRFTSKSHVTGIRFENLELHAKLEGYVGNAWYGLEELGLKVDEDKRKYREVKQEETFALAKDGSGSFDVVVPMFGQEFNVENGIDRFDLKPSFYVTGKAIIE
jgi:hypothetical protein